MPDLRVFSINLRASPTSVVSEHKAGSAQCSNASGLSHAVNTRQITIGLDGQSVHLLNTAAALQSLLTTGDHL